MGDAAGADAGRAQPPAIDAERWHGQPPAAWREQWDIPELRVFRSVGSTNDVARAMAEAGAASGSVVLADEQTRGRGRRGRGWTAPPGQGLLLSIVLRPREPAAAGVLPLRVGLATARAVEEASGVRVGIKWPNDLLAAGRKLGGVLCEAAVEGTGSAFVVAGIGLNLLQRDDDWPPELRGTATSLAAEGDAPPDVPALASRVISEVCMAAESGGPRLHETEIRDLARRDVLRGREVTVDGRPAGRASGIGPDGALLLEAGGATRRIITGTVRPAGDGADQERDDP